MLRAEKAQVIDELGAVFGETGVIVVTHYKGLTVAEISSAFPAMARVTSARRKIWRPLRNSGSCLSRSCSRSMA